MISNAKDTLRKTSGLLLDMVYPPRCAVCDRVCSEVGEVCSNCRDVFSYVKQPRCMKCGKELTDFEKEYCMDCNKKNYHYIRGFPLWNYDKNMRKSVAAFKYHNKREYAMFYAKSIVDKLGEDIYNTKVSHLIPVPIHRSKMKSRGYNQAKVLADEISRLMGIPVLDGYLIRNKKTVAQKELNDKERLRNLSQAFETSWENDIIKRKAITSVMLVDDIYTTGSTIEACTLALMKSGISNVYYTSICIGKGYA